MTTLLYLDTTFMTFHLEIIGVAMNFSRHSVYVYVSNLWDGTFISAWLARSPDHPNSTFVSLSVLHKMPKTVQIPLEYYWIIFPWCNVLCWRRNQQSISAITFYLRNSRWLEDWQSQLHELVKQLILSKRPAKALFLLVYTLL